MVDISSATAKRLRPPAQRCRRRLRWVKEYEDGRNPIGVESDLVLDTQGSRGGNPGRWVSTASRLLKWVPLMRITERILL